MKHSRVTAPQFPDGDGFSWRASLSSQSLSASVPAGSLARSSWEPGGARCRGAGGGPSKPPARALGELDPADTCDGLEAQHHAAAGSLRPLARLASPSPSDSWEVWCLFPSVQERENPPSPEPDKKHNQPWPQLRCWSCGLGLPLD